MAKIKVTPFKDYHDKIDWGEPYNSIDPDTPPHKLTDPVGRRHTFAHRHRRWHCLQYFSRRGFNLSAHMASRILFALKIGQNGGLVDTSGMLRLPANSQATYSSNYVLFKWEQRRARWNKSAFVIDGKKNETIADLFEAAIAKANRAIKPYDITFDKRMRLLSFRKWLYEYTRGKVDYRSATWKVKSAFTRVKLADAGARMSMKRAVLASCAYPFLLQDKSTFIYKFQRTDPTTYRGACYTVVYAKVTDTMIIPRVTNFMCWTLNNGYKGWIKYLSTEPFAPNLPSGKSQQVIRSFPVYMGKYDNPARAIANSHNPTNLYGRLDVISVRDYVFVYRDLSYPATTFSYLDDQEVEFTDEDREWNIQEVFDHRTWDPYEINNWSGSDLITSIRKKNKKHVSTKIRHLLDTDPTFLERSGKQRPYYDSNQPQPEGE